MRFFHWKRAPRPKFDAVLAPDAPFFVVGDVHGRADLLTGLLPRLEDSTRATHLVFVGDYVDRGDQSREVLELLQDLHSRTPDRVVCLMGNHERMLLDFLEEPEVHGPRWLRHGGLQTLASYRISPVSGPASSEKWADVRDNFRAALGPTESWLRALPLVWQSGNVAVVHAAADPALPIGDQYERTLLWGHEDFETVPRRDSVWVVHGHTITDVPQSAQGRIAVDTGAYATGRLTAAHIESGAVTFF